MVQVLSSCTKTVLPTSRLSLPRICYRRSVVMCAEVTQIEKEHIAGAASPSLTRNSALSRESMVWVQGRRCNPANKTRAVAPDLSRWFTRPKYSAPHPTLPPTAFALQNRSIHVRVEAPVSYCKQTAGHQPDRYKLIAVSQARFSCFLRPSPPTQVSWNRKPHPYDTNSGSGN
jgi:hypothetical protein